MASKSKRVWPKQERPGQVLIGGYVPESEAQAIDMYAAQLSEANGGKFVSRTKAMRALYTLGLSMVQQNVVAPQTGDVAVS